MLAILSLLLGRITCTKKTVFFFLEAATLQRHNCIHAKAFHDNYLKAMHIVESSACSCGFVNEDEFHFFFGCPLFNRPRIILQNVISSVAPFTLRTLLYGVDEFDFTENKKIINETLKFIHETKRFE